jgi:hypothetical protein
MTQHSMMRRTQQQQQLLFTGRIIAAPTFVLAILFLVATTTTTVVTAKVADRSRLVQHRAATGQIDGYHDNGIPIEGHSYRRTRRQQQQQQLYHDIDEEVQQRLRQDRTLRKQQQQRHLRPSLKMEESQERGGGNGAASTTSSTMQSLLRAPWQRITSQADHNSTIDDGRRELSSQLSGCCYNYKSYSAANLCALYGNDCESGNTKSHDSGDSSCSGDGLSFIGVSFSVNTANGNPYSYQLCDQFPMENIIDRDYEYVMSMDEDGWLVGGGYKTFDYSGKMPYVHGCCLFFLRPWHV